MAAGGSERVVVGGLAIGVLVTGGDCGGTAVDEAFTIGGIRPWRFEEEDTRLMVATFSTVAITLGDQYDPFEAFGLITWQAMIVHGCLWTETSTQSAKLSNKNAQSPRLRYNFLFRFFYFVFSLFCFKAWWLKAEVTGPRSEEQNKSTTKRCGG